MLCSKQWQFGGKCQLLNLTILYQSVCIIVHFAIEFQRHVCDDRQVGLRNVTRAAEGTYECQVSGEGPLFATVSQEKELKVAGEFHI